MTTTRALDAVLGQPWAIEPDWLHMISAIAQRQFDAPVVAAMQGNPARIGSPGLTVVDGVALIGLIGPIFPRANMMTENSGATSLEMVRAEFLTALANPDIKAIVFQVDSPGGVVGGIGEFASEIFRARAQKPIVTVATGMIASAAYWIGSASSRIVVAPSTSVGSIGVVAGLTKQVAPDQNGEFTFEIVSSNAPDKRPDPADSAGRAAIVARIDAIEALFLADVAQFRGVTVDAVKAGYGRGGVLLGAAAVAAGMADKVDTLDSILTGLAAASPVNSRPSRAAAAASSESLSMSQNLASVAELTAAFPELVAQIRTEVTASASTAALAAARLEGAAAERTRIAAIQSAALPGHEAIVAACIADGSSAGDAALRINAAENATRTAARAAIQGVEGATAGVKPAPSANPAPVAAVPQTADGWKAEWAASAQLQSEFRSGETYANYMQGVSTGRIRVLKAPVAAS